MLALSSMKKHWTLTEFLELDSKFEYKLKHVEKSSCKLMSLEKAVSEEFVAYVSSLNFQRIRVGYLYGVINAKDNSVRAEFIYEPPQTGTDVSFELLQDENAESVARLAKLLQVQRVGWIFSHPPREKNFHFSTAELLCACEQQLEQCNGEIEDADTNINKAFVTIKVTLDEENKPLVDAWQISKQGLEMVAEGAVQVSPDPGHSAIAPTFTAYVEGKPAAVVDNNFFLTRVPIGSFESLFISTFPRLSRFSNNNNNNNSNPIHLKNQLKNLGKQGWTMKSLISDFNCLLWLSQFLDATHDMPKICAAVLDVEVPLDEGYQLLIRSIADI